MAIDISTDLIIQVSGVIQTTSTSNNVFDADGAHGQYDPGKDYSKTDDVSKNGQPIYLINISLNSKTNQDYTIDKLTVGFADLNNQPSAATSIFYINTNPNALNIADDGASALAASSATSPIAVFTTNLKSNSTLSTQMALVLPNETAWKTKIQPTIVVVAEKDGISARQNAKLPSVRLAPKTRYVSNLSAPNQNIIFTPTAFQIPFSILSTADRYPNQILPVIGLTNPTDFSFVTYRVDLLAKINGISAVFDSTGFGFATPVGFTVTNHSLVGTTLEFTVSGPFSSITSGLITNITAKVPYTPAIGENNASVAIESKWSTTNPISIVANNNYQILFELTQQGIASYTAPFVDLTQGGIGSLRLKHVLELNTINTPPPTLPQSITATNDDLFYVASGSKYVLLLDSAIAGIKPNPIPQPVSLIFTDLNGVAKTQVVNPSFYTESFAYVAINATAYNPNTVCHDVVTGVIPTMTYASVIASGNKPNIRMITLLLDPWVGTNFDTKLPHTLQLSDLATDTMSGAEFSEYFAINPLADFTTYWHSYLSLNTNLLTTAQGYALYGLLMAPVDSFENRTSVFLNMGTLQKGKGKTIAQFNDISTVVQFAGIYPWKGQVIYGVTNELGIPLATIADYTKSYCLRLSAATPNEYIFAQPIMKQNTFVVLPIPTAIAPYFVLDGSPYVSDPQGNQTPITNFSYNGFAISFNWPNIETLMGGEVDGGKGGACFPIKLIPPSKTITILPTQPTIPKENLLLHKPGFVTDHMPSSTPFFPVTYSLPPTTLIGLAIDNTGFSVTPFAYNNGDFVKYTALVHNLNFDVSDYYTFNTVPTNQYNEIETSNNAQSAYINSILTFNPTTQVYYQLESDVTANDIAMSKMLSGAIDLKTYYSNTIKTKWINWQGGALPNGLVMLASFTPAILKDELVRIDYTVTVDVDLTTTTQYINEASFKYQSTGSGLEAHSNITKIQNIPFIVPISTVKSVVPNSVPYGVLTPITFTIKYSLPAFVNTAPTTIINFSDIVDNRLVVTGSSFSITSGTYYTVNNLSVGNAVEYQLITAIPQGVIETIPLSATLTITAHLSAKAGFCATIPNKAMIAVNTNTPIISNEVFVSIKSLQSINDLLASIALMQAGLSYVINAEGEKIQKAIAIGTIKQIALVNSSVQSMLKTITRLELLLSHKATQFSCTICCDKLSNN